MLAEVFLFICKHLFGKLTSMRHFDESSKYFGGDWLSYTHRPSGKEPNEVFRKGGGHFTNKVIEQAFCLSHSEWTNQMSSLAVEPVGNSVKLPIGARGDSYCLHLLQRMLISPVQLAEKVSD